MRDKFHCSYGGEMGVIGRLVDLMTMADESSNCFKISSKRFCELGRRLLLRCM